MILLQILGIILVLYVLWIPIGIWLFLNALKRKNQKAKWFDEAVIISIEPVLRLVLMFGK